MVTVRKFLWLAILMCLTFAAHGQRDHQIRIDPGMTAANLHVMLSDTAAGSDYLGRGKWTEIDGIGRIDTAYVTVTGDSLVIIDVLGDTTFFEGGGGAGDNWGSDVVNHDITLVGNGTAGTPLKVDTTVILTFADTIDRIATKTDVPTTEAIQDIVGAMFTGNTETNVTVDYQDADGTIDVLVSASGSSTPYVITPAQLTSDQDNYAPTGIGIATYIYIDSDNGMRAITGIADSTAGTLEKTIINDGSYMIYLPMSHPDSDAAHRFVGWPGDYYLYPGHSVKILYDLVANNWRILGGDMGYTKPTVYYSWSAASVTAGDNSHLGFSASSSGTIAELGAATPLPAAAQMSTATASTNGYKVYFTKGVNRYSSFGAAHQFTECVISIPTLSDGTETFTVELQLMPAATSGTLEQNNTIGIRYSSGINSGKWELFSQDNAAAEDVADSGITVAAATIYKLRIEGDKSNTEYRAYINGAYVGKVESSMPNAVDIGARVMLLKSAGNTARTLNLHSFTAGAIYPY